MAVNSISAYTPPQRLDWKSCIRRIRQDALDDSHNTASALAQTRKWIEECTGCVQDEKTYREYLQDGTLLCELVQRVRPGLIRKINRVRSPFAWRENLSFFLEACQQLGLKGSQLFSPEDLQPSAISPYRSKGLATARGENERRLRNIANTLFLLGRKVKDLPDYSGPQLNPEFGELQPPFKSSKQDFLTTPTSLEARNITLPATPTHSHPNSILSPETEPRKTEESPSIRVSRLESVETHTDKQSFAQVVLYIGSSIIGHKKSAPVEVFCLDHLAESEKSLPELVRLESQESKSLSQQSEDSEGAPVVELRETCAEADIEEGLNPVLLADLANSLSGSRDSLQSPSFESTTTASEVSTVILREQNSSRCSRASFTSSEECGGTSSVRSEFSETESSFNSPLDKRRPPSTDLVFTHESSPFSPTVAVLTDTQEGGESTVSLQSFPPQLSNPVSLALDNTGLLPLEFFQAGSESQESDSIGPYISPRETDTAFHFNLTGSQTSQSEDLGSEFNARRNSSDFLGENTYPLAPPPAGTAEKHLGLISEEPEESETPGEASNSSIPHWTHSSEHTSTGLLSSQSSSPYNISKPKASTKNERVSEERNKKTLSEASKSWQSSTDSLNSTASSASAIVVSYCERSRQAGEEVSDISHTPANLNYTGSFSSTSSCSNQDDSFEESSPDVANRRNKQRLELNSNANFNSGSPEGTGYLPTCPEETKTPTSEDNMAGMLTIFPSHGSGPGTTRTTVPHHSLRISSASESDSPLPQRNSQGRSLYIMPTSSSITVSTSSSHSSSGTDTQETGTGMRLGARAPRSRESAYSERLYEELDIPVVLLPGEKLLGLNMAGRRGQGTSYPRVQAIAGDTPASRSALQSGDELLAVNGTPLHDTPHSKATGLLQQAVSRGKLLLRVRRVQGDSPLHRSQQGVAHGHGSDHSPSPEESSIGPSIMAVVNDPEDQVPVFSPPRNADSALSNSLKVEAGVDISRVRSDALPHSLYAAKLVVTGSSEAMDEENNGDIPDFLSDINSTAVEVGSDCEKLSISDSHKSTPSEVGSRDELNTGTAGAASGSSSSRTGNSDWGETSLVDSVLAVARRHTTSESEKQESDSQTQSRGRGKRPVSAPAKGGRSLSVGKGMSRTLPPNMSRSELWKTREKRTSLDEERQRRRANIQESARAALQYSAKKRSSRTDSLPSHFRTSTLSKSMESEDEYTSSPQHSRTSSSPVSSPSLPTAAQHTPTSGTPSLSSSHTHTPSHAPSTPLNLRHLSIDETREASLTQMDEIWREVEGGKGEGDGTGGESPSVTQPRSDLSSSSGKESERSNTSNTKPSPASSASGGSPGDPKKQLREPVQVSQAGPQSKALEEVDSPALGAATLQPRSHSTPYRPLSATLPRGASASQEAGKKTRAKSFNSKGIDFLLTSLRSLNQRVGTHEEEEEFRLLEETLRSNTFKKAKKFHDTVHSLVVEEEDDAPKSVIRRIVPVAQATRHHLHHHTEPSEEVNELRALLREPHIQALIFCHDKVSTRDLHIPDSPRFHRAAQDPVDVVLSASVLNFNPTDRSRDSSAPLSRDVPTTRKEDATIVFLDRTNRPLGCTIYKQDDAVFIGKLLKGCDAEQSEVLREGDELLEVNGVPVTGRSTDEIVRIMSVEPGTMLAFTIIPVHDDNIDLDYETKYVRAHFNYNGRLDEEIPCKALGLSFQKGDILEISNQDDPFWWQARKVFDDGAESLPGLTPSRHLMQKREALVRSYPMSPATEKKKGIKSIFSKKKKKKIYYQQTPQSGAVIVGDEVVTYEDVMKVDPDSEGKRPIVLIGAPGVGRRTLIRKLLNSDPVHFAAVVQHTTRPIRPGEVNGHNYYFTTKEEFEQEVQQERFLEYGELRGHYYGTSFTAIKRIIEGGRVPVLDVQPQALKVIRYSGLHPYVVFVASPRLERLHITRKMGSEKQKRRLGSSSIQLDLDDPPVYTEADLHHLVEESYLIESQYGHYFDWIIVNDDFQVASDMLKEVARRVEDEPQWVPASWVHDQ